jgi:hypothetical protein
MTKEQFETVAQAEQGGFPIERAVLGSCDLSILHIGGEWQWQQSIAARMW